MPRAPPGPSICLLCSSKQSIRNQRPRALSGRNAASGECRGIGSRTRKPLVSIRKHAVLDRSPSSVTGHGKQDVEGKETEKYDKHQGTKQSDGLYSRFPNIGPSRVPESKVRKESIKSFGIVSGIPHKFLSRRPLDSTNRSTGEPMQTVARRSLAKMQLLLNDSAFKLETGLSDVDPELQFFEFEKTVLRTLEEDARKKALSIMRVALSEAYTTRHEAGLDSQLKYMFAARLANHRFQQADIVNQIKLADLRYPAEWYIQARKMKRVIHLHIGPTNSGKTYHALKKLEEAKTGCYAGPLRLLAHEVYTRLNAKGKQCNLITGDEIIADENRGQSLSSCTVEMVPFGEDLDVAVIDEIQMIGDKNRGWAWTQAVLGLRAKELHLCGEVRTLPLIQQIAASLGEELVIHRYERLSPLKVAKVGLGGKLDGLQKGDCVVSFSRKVLHSLKKEIQNTTGKEVAIVYGALPPEIRAQQANLFNDQENDYDILVASDAIGMGLNLSIKRIIFETMHKFDGQQIVKIDVASIKQIGGRAGRYRTAVQDNTLAQDTTTNPKDPISTPPTIPTKIPNPNIGYITTLHNSDLAQLQAAMSAEPAPILAAGIKPPDSLIIRFSSYFPPGTPFSYILLRLNEISRLHPRYNLCDLKEQVSIADAIQQVEALTIPERMMICYAPVDPRNLVLRPILVALARCVATRSGGDFLSIPEIRLEVLDQVPPPPNKSEDYIMKLAAAHQAVVLYLWLSYRMNSIFRSQALAFYVKSLLQEKLDKALASAKLSKEWLQTRFERMQAARKKQMAVEEEKEEEEESKKKKEGEEMVGGLIYEDTDAGKRVEPIFRDVVDVETGDDGKVEEDGGSMGFIPPESVYRDEVVRGL